MSDANRTKVSWVKETTYGQCPANPAWRNLRIKSSTLAINPKTKESGELNPNRNVRDIIRIANEAGGGLPMELSWGSHDALMELVLQNLWSRTPVRDNNGVAATPITSVAINGVYNFSAAASPTTDYSAATFVVGQLVRASGFTNAGNNGLMRVTTGGNTSMTASAQVTVVDAAPVGAARLKVVGFRGVAGDVTAAAGGLASTALDFTTFPELVIGKWIKIGGATAGEQFATAACNGFARVSGAPTATTLPLDNLPAGWGVDAGAAKTITVFTGDHIRSGVTEQSASLEQNYQALVTPEYDVLLGQVPDLTLTFKQNDLIETALNWVGADGTNGTVRTAGSTDVAIPTGDVLNTGANIGQVRDNGTALTGVSAVTSLELALTNSVRRKGGLGSYASQDLGLGTFRLKGKIAAYYASNVLRTKLLNGTASSWDMRIQDTTAPVGSRCYILDIPKIKYDAGNPTVAGVDTDLSQDPSFQALGSHATYAYAFQFQRMEEYSP